MRCEKCGQQLNNWNAFCPNCGAEAPANPIIEPTVAKAAATINGVSTFAKMSILCWLGMLVLSFVEFQGFYFWFVWQGEAWMTFVRFCFISMIINALSAAGLIFGTAMFIRNNRATSIFYSMVFYWIAALAVNLLQWFIWGGTIPLGNFAYLVLVAVVIIVYFNCTKRGTSMKPIIVSSIACAVAWYAVYIIYFVVFMGIFSFGLLFSSWMIKDLLFFGGTMLLGLQAISNKR